MRKQQTQADVFQIDDAEGNTYTDPSCIAAVFVSHFQDILAPAARTEFLDLSHIIPHAYVTEEDTINLIKLVIISEIDDVIKAANPNKAPGPGGFNAHFSRCVGQLQERMFVKKH